MLWDFAGIPGSLVAKMKIGLREKSLSAVGVTWDDDHFHTDEEKRRPI